MSIQITRSETRPLVITVTMKGFGTVEVVEPASPGERAIERIVDVGEDAVSVQDLQAFMDALWEARDECAMKASQRISSVEINHNYAVDQLVCTVSVEDCEVGVQVDSNGMTWLTAAEWRELAAGVESSLAYIERNKA
jgi:hypothetical protein